MTKNSYTRGSGLLEVFLAKQRAKKADSFIPHAFRKGKILDIGCGHNPYFLLSTKFKQKYGIDPSLSSTKISSLVLKKIDVSRDSLPFENGFFDVVTMLAVFEHIDKERIRFVLTEARRVLGKDGILVITTPSPWSDKLLHVMARVNLISSEEIHEHKHHYSRSRIENILVASGFEKKKVKSGFFEIFMNMWFTVTK